MKSIMLTVIILFAISTVAPLYPSPALAQQNTPDKAKGAKKGCRPGQNTLATKRGHYCRWFASPQKSPTRKSLLDRAW
ncbi:hypothetical protein [Bradyrhizobium sp. BR 1432]|uniref:hypothetical protein n=1 Tax=Bradyrhizobium sp. BR 1432 TaxID=3447966 RepID=UPI003EE50798